MPWWERVFVGANVVLIVVNIRVYVGIVRLRRRIEQQLRAHEFVATEPTARREGP